jgi:choice-of-anchor B domain-containing protein
MSLRAQVPLSTATDVSAQGNLVFVGRSAAGATIVDVTNPDSPVVLTTWVHPSFGQVTNAVRALGNHLYVSNETGGPFGLYALNITNPAAPALVSAMGPPVFPSNVHNLWADNHHLYLSGYGDEGGNVVVDVANPAAPVRLAVIPVGIHDNTVIGSKLYIAGGWDGFFRYDITNPAAPVAEVHFTAEMPDTSYYAHIAWPIDNRYVFAAEEVQIPPSGYGPGSYRVLDFLNPGNPVEVFRWYSENAKNDRRITTHNVYVVGTFAYLSHYQDGVRVMDVSDPREPVEVAWYDTFPQPVQSLFQGCWGVYPFQGDDKIYASDRSNGLFILRFNGARKGTITGLVRNAVTLAPIPGAAIITLTANRSTQTAGNGTYTLKTGAGTHSLRASATGFHPQTAQIVLANLGSTVADFLLVPTSVAVDDPAADVPAATALTLALSPNPMAASAAAIRTFVPGTLAGKPLALAIYGVNGTLVRAFEHGAAIPGLHAEPWDGRDAAGQPVGPGVYFVRLAVGEEVRSAKLVVAR